MPPSLITSRCCVIEDLAEVIGGRLGIDTSEAMDLAMDEGLYPEGFVPVVLAKGQAWPGDGPFKTETIKLLVEMNLEKIHIIE